MLWWHALVLGLLQGLAEFLPISSSGHLVLGQHFLGLPQTDDVTFEVFVHFGTTLSILTVYWRRVLDLIAGFFRGLPQPREAFRTNGDFQLSTLILLSMLPAMVVYATLGDAIEEAFADPRFACWMLLVTGTLLLLTLLRKNPSGPLTPLKAFLIGCAQAVAMLPGISRSGATICTALYQDVDRKLAADFSFLMLLPVVLGATLLKTLDMLETGMTIPWSLLVLGAGTAYVFGIVAIKVVIEFVRRGKIQYFAYYCFAAGILGLLFIP